MSNTSQLLNTLYSYITGSDLALEVNGSVYLRRRPTDSKMEDIIINTPTIGGRVLQIAKANIHIYVPDIKVSNTQYMPNNERIAELEMLATEILGNSKIDGYTNLITDESVYEAESTKEHIIVLELELRTIKN